MHAEPEATAEQVREGVRAAGGTPIEFGTIAISDGITMGTDGMRASLVSREVIADSIESPWTPTLSTRPWRSSAATRRSPPPRWRSRGLNVPSIVLYGGAIQPGRWRERDVTIQDVFEAVGACAAGKMSETDLADLEARACPGAGACGGQFTANTMAAAMTALGLSPMGANDVPATDAAKDAVARECGALVMRALERDIRPSRLITRASLLNAIAVCAATGGSTNAVLHLLAIAREADVFLTLDDFDAVAAKTPVIADLKPGGGAPPSICIASAASRSSCGGSRRPGCWRTRRP